MNIQILIAIAQFCYISFGADAPRTDMSNHVLAAQLGCQKRLIACMRPALVSSDNEWYYGGILAACVEGLGK